MVLTDTYSSTAICLVLRIAVEETEHSLVSIAERREERDRW